MSDNVSPLLPEQFEELRRLELEALAELGEYGELPRNKYGPVPQDRILCADAIPPPALLTWQGERIAAAGNIVAVCGQSKSGKSTFYTGIVKGYLAGGGPVWMDELTMSPVDSTRQIQWHDTEMASYHVHRNLRRALNGNPNLPANFFAYEHSQFKADEKKQRFFAAVYEHRPEIVILDGIAHFLYDVNDTKQCAQLIEEIKILVTETGTCLFTTIHDNQGKSGLLAEKARGHIGSELERICDSQIVCARAERKKNAPIVLSIRNVRDGDYASDLCILFDPEGKPYGGGVYEQTGKPKKLTKVEQTREKLIAEYAGRALSYSDLRDKIIQIEDTSASTAERRVKELGFEQASSKGYYIPLE